MNILDVAPTVMLIPYIFIGAAVLAVVGVVVGVIIIIKRRKNK
jgi:hypothetical protein